jgi:hypothetical protein
MNENSVGFMGTFLAVLCNWAGFVALVAAFVAAFNFS